MTKPILLSWSGGKDCAWALHLLHTDARFNTQYEVVGLVTTINSHFARVAMHGYREALLDAQANAAGLPLWKVPLPWPCTNEIYEERMAAVCERAVREGIYGFAFGDLFLEDIRAYRIETLAPTGLAPIFPCWGIPTDQLARQMIAAGVRAHLVCVNPANFPAGNARSFAGHLFDDALLAALPPSVDPCGERGEFHTFVAAAPCFSRSIEVSPGEIVERDSFLYADLLPAWQPAP